MNRPTIRTNLALVAVLTLLQGCPGSLSQSKVTRSIPTMDVKTASRPAKHESAQQEVMVGVQWPGRSTQAIPFETKAVTFFVFKGEALLDSITIIWDPAIPNPTKSVKLYPGDYIVRVRAYNTDSPVDGTSPIIASGAASLTVFAGENATVDVTLTLAPTPSPSSSPMPSPTPTPTSQPTSLPSTLPTGHWVRQNSGTISTLFGIHFIDEFTGWAVGDGNHILHTEDGGQTWVEQCGKGFPGQSDRLLDVRFRHGLLGWAVGGNWDYYVDHWPSYQSVLMTTDGGQNWNPVSIPKDGGGPYEHISVVSTSSVVLTSLAYSYCSTNNGSTWTQYPRLGGWMLFFFNLRQCYIVDSAGMHYSDSAGESRKDVSIPSGIGPVMTVYFSSPFSGSAITQTGKVLRTIDGGANWTLYGSAPEGTNLRSFTFNSQGFGYGIAEGNRVYLTTDGGISWRAVSPPEDSTTALNGIYFTNSDSGWAVGTGGSILRYQY